MSNILKTLAAGSAGGDYQISRSLRFNSADSAYLSRTPASAGNRKTWTWSGWVKRTGPGNPSNAIIPMFGACSAASDAGFFAIGVLENVISIQSWNTAFRRTSVVFRDYSAWYHIVAYLDTTQATAANRLKLYVNNVEITAFSISNDPTLNTDYAVNNNISHKIFSDTGVGSSFLSGYLTEVHFIDGQALTPSSFGEVNATTGVWSPIAYAGSYGTNGFYLNFSDNSGVTSTTLGKDQAGSNDWTPSGSPGFSVTAGAGNDSLVDSPTQYGTDTGAGGEVRGNYCTLNPLTISGITFTNGNLAFANTGNTSRTVFSSVAVTSGKWYAEVKYSVIVTGTVEVGVVWDDSSLSAVSYPGNRSNGYAYSSNGQKYNNGSGSAYGASWSTANTIGIALDLDAGTVTFYKDGVSQGTAFSSLPTDKTWFFAFGSYGNTGGGDVNFGQRPFAYTAPSGFKALVTTNLPEPTVVQGDDYFNTVTRTFTGATASVSSLDFSPDFLWFKRRDGAASHSLYDRLRGTNSRLLSNDTSQALTTTSAELTSFDANGFTVGADSGQLSINGPSGGTGVVWAWKANGAGVSNTDGTISSTVSVSTTSGFSIVTYTGNGTGGATVGHGLGAVPKMFILKERSGSTAADFWATYHVSLGNTKYLTLNTTNAEATAAYWNNTTPSSSVITLGSNTNINDTGATYVIYAFAEVEGFSKFGSYTGNQSTDGPFVYCGFKPAFILIKANHGVNWVIFDTARNTYNLTNVKLFPNVSDAETGAEDAVDVLSNGFKIRTSNNKINDPGMFHIFVAFASNPFKTSLAR